MIRRAATVLLFFLLAACARQTTPNGGPKDKKPPILIRSTPAANQTNFKGKTLTFTFDEAIQVKDARNEIIIAPSPGKDVVYQAKQNRVIITLKEPLRDSTTYNINFREGVQDLTENNPPTNLRLAFSTGTVLDTLSISGKVADALIEKIPDKITIAVYQSDTFNIFKHTPSYITKSDELGNYIITNLKAGTYRIYAFDDKNKNLKLESNSEKYGFQPGQINLTESKEIPTLRLVTLDARPLLLSNIRHNNQYSKVKFNKSVISYTLATDSSLRNSFGDDQSEINIYTPDTLTDSLKVSIQAHDSVDHRLDTTLYVKKGTLKPEKNKLEGPLSDLSINPTNTTLTATITFNKPIIKINTDSILISIDSLHTIPFDNSQVIYDTIHNKISFFKPLPHTLFDTAKNNPKFFLGKDAFRSIDQDSSNQITKPLAIPKLEDIATLELLVQTNEPHFVIQLLTPDYKLVQSSANEKKITFKNLPPGSYKIRAIADTNNNQLWDPGNITKDTPPERTYFYQNNDGKYEFPLRANWEVGPYTIHF